MLQRASMTRFTRRLRGVMPPSVMRVFQHRRVTRLLLLVACAVFALMLLLPSMQSRKPRIAELPLQQYVEEAHKRQPATQPSEFNPVRMAVTEDTTIAELCQSFPKALLKRIQPVLKVGHGDADDKLKAQMGSVSACFEPGELLVVSDFEEDIVGGHHTTDVLARLPRLHYNSTVFTKWASYENMQALKGDKTKFEGKVDGWAIDKYKFLPAVDVAWEKKPDKEFYVFYETDTYIFWDSMFRLLATLDPDDKIYMGSPTPGHPDAKRLDQATFFANGGPGYVISRGAMRAMMNDDATVKAGSLAVRWSDGIHDGECCGDQVLGWALWSLGVQVHGRWPMFQPFHTDELLYDDEFWCMPIVSMHKVPPNEMLDMFRLEFAKRDVDRPFVYGDVWSFFKPGSVAIRHDWNSATHNTRDEYDPPKPARHGSPSITNFEECGNACARDSRCLQWKWLGGDAEGANRCILASSLQAGKAAQPVREVKDGKETGKMTTYTSGWLVERGREWREKRTCKDVHWLGSSVNRRL